MSDQGSELPAKILIAEDDAIVALDLQGMVMRMGYDVVAIVDSGEGVIAAVERFRPDIILLDLGLNGPVAGIEIARQIRILHDVPVIFCVSSSDLSSLIRAKDISYAGYLLKPINPDSLSTTMDTALYKYNLERRIRTAEQNYQRLANTCQILHYFFDRNAALEWTWNRSGPIVFKTENIPDGFPLEEIVSKMQSLLIPELQQMSGRLSCQLNLGEGNSRQLYAIICLHSDENSSVNGLLIPLDRGEL